MSVLTIPGLRRTARETIAAAKHAGQTPTQLKQTIARLTVDNETVTAANEDLVCELMRAMIRVVQDATRIAELDTELKAAVAEVKRLQQKVIRSAAEQERLRQAVIDARPRINQMDTQLVRPFAPEVVLPYVSPVPYSDSSNETTQELPLVDLPGQRSPAA